MNRPTNLHIDETLYWTICIYDISGLLQDADSTPTVGVLKNGTDTETSGTVVKRSATTGLYDCSYNPSGENEGDIYSFEENVYVNSGLYFNTFQTTILAQEQGTYVPNNGLVYHIQNNSYTTTMT